MKDRFVCQRSCRVVLAAVVLSSATTIATSVAAQDGRIAPEADTGRYAKSAATATKYMVAAANPLAVEAGLEMLRKGGSAVDAAIATQLVLNLVEPQSSGIGGGAFMLHWDQIGRRAPNVRRPRGGASRRDAGPLHARRQTHAVLASAVKSGLSIGVPGLVKLLEHAHLRHGQIALGRTLCGPPFDFRNRVSGYLPGSTTAPLAANCESVFA